MPPVRHAVVDDQVLDHIESRDVRSVLDVLADRAAPRAVALHALDVRRAIRPNVAYGPRTLLIDRVVASRARESGVEGEWCEGGRRTEDLDRLEGRWPAFDRLFCRRSAWPAEHLA